MKALPWIILAVVILAVGLYFLFRNRSAAGGLFGNGTDGGTPALSPEETAHKKFLADCKKAGLSEVFCAQAWANSGGTMSFSDFGASGYGNPAGACVEHTQASYNAKVDNCWKKCLPYGLIPGGFAQADCFEKCKKKIPPVISCP